MTGIIFPHNGLIKKKAAAGGGSPTQADILALTPYVFWSLQDLSDVWQDSSRTTNVSADGQTIAVIDDLASGGRNLTQATTTKEPEFDETSSVRSFLTTSADPLIRLGATLSSQPTDCSIFMGFKSSSLKGALIHEDSSTYIVYDNASSSAPAANLGSPSIYVDGALISNTRSALSAAVTDGAWHVIEVRNANLSSWAVIYPGLYSGAPFVPDANVGCDIIIIPTANFDATDRDNTIIPYMEANLGL